MKSFIASAVLSAVALSSAANAASIRHSHIHRRAPAAASAAVEKRAAAKFMLASDVALLGSSVLLGVNAGNDQGGAITVGNKGPFVVEFDNQSGDDIVVIVWHGAGLVGSATASFVGSAQPDVTHGLKHNTTTFVSFDPSQNGGAELNGAWSAVYPDTDVTTQWGQVKNTWGEYTFTTATEFSTTDISRLVSMSGKPMTIENHPDQSSTEAACTATMSNCAYTCADGADTCAGGSMPGGCTSPKGATTADQYGFNGGCAGMTSQGGYVKVTFN